jgi:hypothetical protein
MRGRTEIDIYLPVEIRTRWQLDVYYATVSSLQSVAFLLPDDSYSATHELRNSRQQQEGELVG